MGACTSGQGSQKDDARTQRGSLDRALKSDVDRVKSEISDKSGNQTAADEDADYIYEAGITRTRSFIAEHVETHYTIEEELGALHWSRQCILPLFGSAGQGQFATVFKAKHKKTGRVRCPILGLDLIGA